MDDYTAYAALAATLMALPGMAPGSASRLVKRIFESGASADDLLDSSYSLHQLGQQPLDLAQLPASLDTVRRSLDAGIRPVSIIEPEYPHALTKIEDAPPLIYVRGAMRALKALPGLAIVGTRQASKNGLVVAERLSAYFAAKGWLIVSGLALGIDAAAHRGAVNAGGLTIAVMAHGLDEIYPKTNKNLAMVILESGGALLSEYEPGVAAKPEQFVLRNRIQIGLSAGSVVVEGEERSGTNAQAEYCLRNRRCLFGVVPNEQTAHLQLQSRLPRILVERRGAVPITSRNDYEQLERLIREKREELLWGNKAP